MVSVRSIGYKQGYTLDILNFYALAEAVASEHILYIPFWNYSQRAADIEHIVFYSEHGGKSVGASYGPTVLPCENVAFYLFYHDYQLPLGGLLGMATGLNSFCRVCRCRYHIAPSSASGASSCTREPRSRASVCSMPTCISGESRRSSL